MVEERQMTGLAAVAAFRSDGRRLATTGPNGDLKVWDTSDPRQPHLLIRLSRRHRVVGAAWNPTAADLLATLSTDGSISIWRMVDDRPPLELLRLLLPYGRSGVLTWLPDGRRIACATADGVVSAWDLGSGSRQMQVLGSSSVCLSMFPETEGVLRAVYRDGSIRRTGTRTRHIHPVTAAAWSAGGSLLAVGREDGSVEVRDEPLHVRWVGEPASTGSLQLAWHGESSVLVADRAGRSLSALDGSGRTRWLFRLAAAPGSLSVAGDIVAVGGCTYAPLIVEVASGITLSGGLPGSVRR